MGRLAAVILAALAALALAGCGAAPEPDPSPTTASAAPTDSPDAPDTAGLRIVTSDIPELSGMEALMIAVLSADEAGCVQAGDGGTLVWPAGYQVQGDASAFEIVDAAGNVVAQSGQELHIGGGGADELGDGWSGTECATGESIWMVGMVSSS